MATGGILYLAFVIGAFTIFALSLAIVSRNNRNNRNE